MENFVPKEKLSKKAKRELDRQKRGGWGAVNPVTRVVQSKKEYNRKKVQKGDFFLVEPFPFL